MEIRALRMERNPGYERYGRLVMGSELEIYLDSLRSKAKAERCISEVGFVKKGGGGSHVVDENYDCFCICWTSLICIRGEVRSQPVGRGFFGHTG